MQNKKRLCINVRMIEAISPQLSLGSSLNVACSSVWGSWGHCGSVVSRSVFQEDRRFDSSASASWFVSLSKTRNNELLPLVVSRVYDCKSL